jgi:hypothetical protein
LVGWMSASLTQRDGVASTKGLCDLGGIILAEGLHDWGRQVVPFFFAVIRWHLP